MSSRVLTLSLLLLAATACGDAGTADDDPDPIDARGADADAAPQPRSFSLTIPATGETMDLSLDVEGRRVTVTRAPSKLRLLRTSTAVSTDLGALDGTTLADKCADFDAEPFVHANIAPLRYGSFGFSLEYGPGSPELRAAIRAELDRRGLLRPDGLFNVVWTWGETWGKVDGTYIYAADARSPTIPVPADPMQLSVAAWGERTFDELFDGLEGDQVDRIASLSIGYVCDLANGKLRVLATTATSPATVIEVVLNP